MHISNILRLKLPTADFRKDIILQDDGQGAYIKEWNVFNVPLPTQADINQWAIELQSQHDLNVVLQAREAAYPAIKDMVVALWENILEDRPEAMTALEQERISVKARFPKPTE